MLWPIATFLMHLLDVRACVCMRIQMCGGFASKITDGIVTGSSWTIYGVFLFVNGDLFDVTPIILNGNYLMLRIFLILIFNIWTITKDLGKALIFICTV